MQGYVSANIISLIYLIILSSVYFLKRKYNFLESRIYKSLIITTILTLLVDIINTFYLNKLLPYINLLSKLYFLILLIWLVIFIFYTILNLSNKKYDKFKMMLKDSVISKCVLSFFGIMSVLMLFSEITYNVDISIYSGTGVTLVYITGIVSSLFLFLFTIVNNRNNKNYKNWVNLISFVILYFSYFLAIKYNYTFVLGSGISIITILYYFTVENPDIKYIEELNVLKEKAEEANKEKTNFLASMSHEIRTPMNVIIGLSQSILSSDLPKTVREDMKNINKASDTLLEIVNNILDITKIEEGKTKINIKPYSLADVIAELSNIVNVSIGEKPIKFSVKTIGNIPSVLNGDEVKMYQILMNLLSNAVKYTNKGSITLVIESKIFGDKANLTFKVIDTGIGIKKAYYDKIFQKFERLGQEQKTIQGTGLGLSITKKLVDMLGGKVYFESEYQKGTTFTVELTQVIVNKTKIADISAYKAKRKVVEEYFDGSQYEILLVDDNLLNLKVAEKLLKPYGFKVTTANSGLDCLNYTKNKNFDLILLDHMMPEMDGIQTLYNLKKRAHGFETPVVVLTANVIEGSKDMYLREGFCAYLSKPINQVELDDILREQLHIGEGE